MRERARERKKQKHQRTKTEKKSKKKRKGSAEKWRKVTEKEKLQQHRLLKVQQLRSCLLQGPPGLAWARSTDAAASAAGPSRESEGREAPITSALMVQEEAEKISVEEDSPPCEGGSDNRVKQVLSRMVWINIH